MMCPNCNKELLNNGSDSYEECNIEEEGIVTSFTCTNTECEVEEINVYTKINE